MSVAEAPSSEVRVDPTDFDIILGELAQNMRLYDELREQQDRLVHAQKSAQKPLESIDINLPAEEQPEGLALAALKALIIDRQIAELQRQMPVSSPLDTLGLLYGTKETKALLDRRVKITSTDPERYFIGTSTSNGDGLSRWHETKKGKITGLGLGLGNGSYITVKGRSGLVYSASPLIDRERDYQPAFTVEFI